jgi:hypothetical protein
MAFVLVATSDGAVPILDGVPTAIELGGRRVHGLARRRDEWWAVADRHTVVHRDGGGTWTELATADQRLTCVLPAPGGAWCGTAEGQVLRLLDGRFAPSDAFDAVEGRESWHAVGSRVPYVRSLTATADDRALLASVHVGGIPRSGNGGASWKPTIDPDADVHQVRAHPSDPGLVLAPAAIGLGVSRDAGATWDVTTDGLHATYLRAVAYTQDAALVSACDGPFGQKGALYRWDTLAGGERPRRSSSEEAPLAAPTSGAGGERVRVGDGLPEWLAGNVDTGMLDADGTVAAFADPEAIYVSTDGGRAWSAVASDLGEVRGIGVFES